MILELIPKEAQRIIVAPLNWGLGHAARSIPIITKLLEAGKEVIIASDGGALELLRQEYPQLPHHQLPSYNVTYNYESLTGIILSNAYKVSSAIRAESKACRKLVEETTADMVISDCRFGFRCSRVPSVIITHQLRPYSHNKVMAKLLELGNRQLVNKFDEVWVPDEKDHKLSGSLSQNEKISNQKFIGVLSRMQKAHPTPEKNHDLTIILSGPEPARTKLEHELVAYLEKNPKQICLIRGTTEAATMPIPKTWKVVDLADSGTINSILLQTKTIVSRSGYSSIMDYYSLGIPAMLIPTPGQSEQEYLAEYLDGRYGFRYLKEVKELEQ